MTCPQWNPFSEPYPAMRMKAWLGKSMTAVELAVSQKGLLAKNRHFSAPG
jgi:hypothetical protein